MKKHFFNFEIQFFHFHSCHESWASVDLNLNLIAILKTSIFRFIFNSHTPNLVNDSEQQIGSTAVLFVQNLKQDLNNPATTVFQGTNSCASSLLVTSARWGRALRACGSAFFGCVCVWLATTDTTCVCVRCPRHCPSSRQTGLCNIPACITCINLIKQV